MTKSIVYIDSEIGIDDKRIKDLGAIKNDRSSFHSPSLRDFYAFISDADFVCGHNVVHHDLAYPFAILRFLLAMQVCHL